MYGNYFFTAFIFTAGVDIVLVGITCCDCGDALPCTYTLYPMIKHIARGSNTTTIMIINHLTGQMCDDCRVNAQFHQQNNPFAGADRPRVRTTEDYLSKRKDH